MKSLRPIHPFPARMAPEIALDECRAAKQNAVLLDPMSGSGTSLRIASDRGLTALGFDLDPLAVLISRVWTRKLGAKHVAAVAADVVAEARSLDQRLPWIDDDLPTTAFIDFWFAEKQKVALRGLAGALIHRTGPAADACRVALSRLIVTKDRGASKARDTSHSRPHVVYQDENYDVILNFERSVARVSKILEDTPPSGSAKVRLGDARKLATVEDGSVDIVVTSPPYLNAIDYMRGHRLSLVWLGYSLGELGTVRSSAIGTERRADAHDMEEAHAITNGLELSRLDARSRSMIDRYANDVIAMIREIRRALKSGGTAVLAVGNSCLKGCYVENASIVSAAAETQGLELLSRVDRELPAGKRYLPPPTQQAMSDLGNRMRCETVLKFRKSSQRRGSVARASQS